MFYFDSTQLDLLALNEPEIQWYAIRKHADAKGDSLQQTDQKLSIIIRADV